MRHAVRRLVLVSSVAFVVSSSLLPARPATTAAHDPELSALLARANLYVVEFTRVFSNVVAEEEYDQKQGMEHRKTRADIIFVPMAGPFQFGSFRDVFEYNGAKVRDREARLEKLFLSDYQTALKKARAIRLASARYNIGGVDRTINEPTLCLMFLHPANQHRFHFERKGTRSLHDVDGVEVRFEETSVPTLVGDGETKNLPARGRFWIDPEHGTVLASEARWDLPGGTRVEIAVDFRPEPTVPEIWVPGEMREHYRLPSQNTSASAGRYSNAGASGDIEARARYSNYRHFGVTTSEEAALPDE